MKKGLIWFKESSKKVQLTWVKMFVARNDVKFKTKDNIRETQKDVKKHKLIDTLLMDL